VYTATSFSAYSWYQGSGQRLMRENTDAPSLGVGVRSVVCDWGKAYNVLFKKIIRQKP